MTLAPLLSASPAIQLHAFAAMTAFVFGLVQLAAPKGTLPHRTLGFIWVGLMLVVAGSSFWISPDPADRSLEPDSSAVDLHAGDAGHGRSRRAPAQRPQPQDRDDLDLCRRAGHRRAVHAGARTDHARRDFRPVNPAGFPTCGRPLRRPIRRSVILPVSPCKNEGKKHRGNRFRGGY